MDRSELVLTVTRDVFIAAINKGAIPAPADRPPHPSRTTADLGEMFKELAVKISESIDKASTPRT